MFEKFEAFIKCVDKKEEARDELIAAIGVGNKQEVAEAIAKKRENAPTILCELVKSGEAEVLTAIVNLGSLASLDLNDKVHEYKGRSLIQICANRLYDKGGDIDNISGFKDNLNKIYQILLYGGIETKMQELVYNTKKKASMASEVATGWAATLTGGLANILTATGATGMVEYAANTGYDGAYDFLKGKIGEDAVSKLGGGIQAVVGTGVNLTSVMLNTAWEYAPVTVDTRIAEAKNRSQILSKGDDAVTKHSVLLNSLPNCSATSMSLSLFLLSKLPEGALNADYADKDFQKEVIYHARYNQDHKAVILLLDDIFDKTKMSSKDRAELICKLVAGALKKDNPQLVDHLLIYYKAKNRSDYDFLREVDGNAKLKDAFNKYIERHKNDIQALRDELDRSAQEKLSVTMLVEQYGLSRQALAYYKDDKGTLLHLFVYKASLEQVTKLVMAGVDLKAKDSRGYTALYHAATEGSNKNENQASYIEIIKTIVYGDSYSLFKDFGHNMGAKTEGTMLQGIGDIFRETTGASFRRVTSEQSDLSQDKEAVMEMMKWLPADDLNFVMFYMVKRWPDKVMEWADELLVAANQNPNTMQRTSDAIWELAGYEKNEKAEKAVELMRLHIVQAEVNLQPFMKEMWAKPDFLSSRLGYQSPAFFWVVTSQLQKGQIASIDDAKKLYDYYTDVYSVASESCHKDFKQAVSDILARGFTSIKFVNPTPKTPAELLVYLADKMYEESYEKVAFIEAIKNVDTTDVKVKSLDAVGEAIINSLCADEKDADWQIFKAAATKLWRGERDPIVKAKKVPALKVEKKEGPKLVEPAKAVVKTDVVNEPKAGETKLDKTAPNPVMLQKPDWESIVKPALNGLSLGARKKLAASKEQLIEAAKLIYEGENTKTLQNFIDSSDANVKALLLRSNKEAFVAKVSELSQEENKKPKPAPQPIPTRTSHVTAWLAGLFTVITLYEAVVKVGVPYFVPPSSSYELGNREIGAVLLGGFFGTCAIGLSTYKSPPLGVVVTALSTAASLYFGNNSENEKLIIGIGGAVAFVTSCVATYYMNDKQPAVEAAK